MNTLSRLKPLVRSYRTPTRHLALSAALEERLRSSLERHEAILAEMNSVGHTAAALGQELSSLARTVRLYQERQALDEEETALQDLLQQVRDQDAEMTQECQEEIKDIQEQRKRLEERLVDSVLPQDEDDQGTDAIIEVRAGTGGDEASLFAHELVECYSKTAKNLHWKVEVLSETRTEIGGLREASLSVSAGGRTFYLRAGDDEDDEEDDPRSMLGPFGFFKFESGVHRVQRVPVNDSSRIHTSAVSVAVLPSIAQTDRGDELLPASELKIETMRASGAGGQHVNTTDSAVRITHLPTKITASIQDERSQHKNKEKALRLIAARVRDLRRSEEERARGETRSSLMGGGDRSERIRTYNFPQDRITDHRSKESQFGISTLMNGGKDDGAVVTFLAQLKALHKDEQLEKLNEEKDA